MNLIEKTLSEALSTRFSDKIHFKPAQVTLIAEELGIKSGEAYKYTTSFPKIRRGLYNLESVVVPLRKSPTQEKPLASAIQSVTNSEVYVPAKDQYYVSWGNSKDIEMIVSSGIFYPTFVTGLSGNGKTTMVEQACARTNREYVRVQITPETDEDDLIGGFRLINGETVFSKGPVVKAMEAGALLLIDEIDRGSNKIMCLQGVLEGKPIMIKKTGQVVKPKSGFNVIATANTKGQGSVDGRFISATIIDDAFLERFTITVEQPYPSLSIEKKILAKHMDKYDCKDLEFAARLTQWSETIRKTFDDGGVDDIISTRRLCHIVQTYAIFNDREKAIDLCISRFDEDTKVAFKDLYKMIDDTVQSSFDAEPASLSDALESALNDV